MVYETEELDVSYSLQIHDQNIRNYDNLRISMKTNGSFQVYC